MEYLGTFLVIIWLAGHIALFSGDVDETTAWIVIIAVIMDILFVIGLVISNAEANEKKREVEEKKRVENLRKNNLSIIDEYKIKNHIRITKADLFEIENRFRIFEIVDAVALIKNETTEIVEQCRDIKRKIDEILLCPNCSNDETAKSIYLKNNLQELEKLSNEYKLLCDVISKYKIELINEDKKIHDSLEQSFNHLLSSKKCLIPNSVLGISNHLISTKPRELSLFNFKYNPIILRLNSFYFCLFSNVILVFDSNGTFSNAIDPSAMSIDIDLKRENVRYVNDERRGNVYTDIDSKLIQRGYSTTRWTYSRNDGGPDLRYSHNPQITIRTDEYEYARVILCINEKSMMFDVSSEKAISAMQSLNSFYLKNQESTYDVIPTFLNLIVKASGESKEALNILNCYLDKKCTENRYCRILGRNMISENNIDENIKTIENIKCEGPSNTKYEDNNENLNDKVLEMNHVKESKEYKFNSTNHKKSYKKPIIIGSIIILSIILLSNFDTSFEIKPNADIENNINVEDITERNVNFVSQMIGRKYDSDGSITVSEEEGIFLDNGAQLFNIKGHFELGTTSSGEAKYVIDLIDWTSDSTVNDFNVVKNGLAKLYGTTFVTKSYFDYSDEAYMWKDVDEYEYVICWKNSNDTITIRWIINID